MPFRAVHNIVRLKGNHRVIVSYTQHGNAEDGFEYENICPFCAVTLEFVEDDDEIYPTEQEVCQRLADGMVSHIRTCPRAGSVPLGVYVTDKPLGTEKRHRVV